MFMKPTSYLLNSEIGSFLEIGKIIHVYIIYIDVYEVLCIYKL